VEVRFANISTDYAFVPLLIKIIYRLFPQIHIPLPVTPSYPLFFTLTQNTCSSCSAPMSEPVAPTIIHLPRGLDRAVLRILSYHVGREHAISHFELFNALSIYQIDARQLHAQIRQLRRSGYLVGSASGQQGR